MDAAFHRAQAMYDAAEPEDFETDPQSVATNLYEIVDILCGEDFVEQFGEVHPLSDRQATVAIWIDGHEYSLTLNREDD
jgi:hypothetical protein